MLTLIRLSAKSLSSSMLTFAIVACVVVVNSVAWGIPLLLGEDGRANSLPAAVSITTGSVAKPPKTDRRRVEVSTAPPVPLPRPAPPRETKRTGLSFQTASQTSAPTRSKPSTLFPRPEPRLILRSEPGSSTVMVGREVSKVLSVSRPKRTHFREVVLVSPYTPGVRVSPNRRGHEWRHRNLRAQDTRTTLDTARAIALRAAQRFKEMRNRMAKLDAQTASVLSEGRLNRQSMRPVAPRPPRIAGQSSGFSESRSARAFVRARLTRRPIEGAVTSPQRAMTRSVKLPRDQASLSHGATRTLSGNGRIARFAPVSSRKIKRVGRSKARDRTRARRAKARRAKRHRSRITQRLVRARKTRRKSRSRKINGFRRGFHRQLVAANFFGSSN